MYAGRQARMYEAGDVVCRQAGAYVCRQAGTYICGQADRCVYVGRQAGV